MKNYLKTNFIYLKKTYNYYKALSVFTLKQRRYKFINFLCLIKYIIFEEVSYLLKLKPRIMNQLEAEQLIEEAKQYAHREIRIWVSSGWDNSKNVIRETIFKDVTSISTQVGKEKISVEVYAKLQDIQNKKIYSPSLKSIVDEFKRLDNLKE